MYSREQLGCFGTRDRGTCTNRLTISRHEVEEHLHNLRGEFGSGLLESGVAVHPVRYALGHANISVTSTYSRSRIALLEDACGQRQHHRAGSKLGVNEGSADRLGLE